MCFLLDLYFVPNNTFTSVKVLVCAVLTSLMFCSKEHVKTHSFKSFRDLYFVSRRDLLICFN
mgnify:CR=1 FL=1